MIAPILLFCYNRPAHLKQTVEALQANPLAKNSPLIVYSDGPKNTDEEENVNQVRGYLKSLDGFSSIKLNFSKKNLGLAQSIIQGVSEILENYDNAIIMEDDLVCSTDYLEYMNDALQLYKDNPLIISISGYSFGIVPPQDYTEETALVLRASSWGWATWKDRWEKVDWQVSDYSDFRNSAERINDLKNAGEDIVPMLIKQQQGIISSWAVRWTYHHVKHKGYCLIPLKSKIQNIGTDGSGTNFTTKTKKYQQELSNIPVNFNPNIHPNPDITHFIRISNKPSIYRKLVNFFKFKVW
jgi:glycosyltransferase involved in cell wall biosynthesis